LVSIGKKNREFFATIACYHAVGGSNCDLDCSTDLFEAIVTGQMAVMIIERLEQTLLLRLSCWECQ